MGKTYFIETFGCQMNKGDSELMDLSMKKNGFTQAGDPGSADVAIFNTCSVRQHAEDRALARIMQTRKTGKGKNPLVVVTGCMAQRIGEELLADGTADIAAGPYQSPGIGDILMDHMQGSETCSYLSQDPESFFSRIPEGHVEPRDMPWHRWVTITHGCENYCAYCIVASVRGKLISFPSEEILKYVSALAKNGIREITLLGQNVNQFGMDSGDIPFPSLLAMAAEVPGIERVNFLTSHPMDFSDDIVRVIAEHRNISRSIHLPLQSGSDRVLELMNRHYTMARYRDIVETIDRNLNEYSISTDLIVGFPGETEAEFHETLKAVKNIRFDDAFTYAYSPRDGTPAGGLQEELTRNEKIERLQTLIELQRKISREKLLARINATEETIVEKLSKKSERWVMGKTFLNHPVVLPGSTGDIGKKLRVRIEGVRGSTLRGVRVS